MRIHTLLLTLMALGAGSSHATLVAHWMLNDGAGSSIADSSGNGRTANQAGGAAGPTLGSAGIEGTASTFGDAGYWATGTDAAFASRSFTVSLWIKAEPATGTWRSPISNRNGENGFIIYRSLNNSSIQFWLKDASDWNPQAAPNITDFNQWYHVVGSFDDTTNEKKFYFHGESDPWGTLINTVTTDEYIAGVSALGIGGRGPNGDSPWGSGGDQLIDDVQFYDTALSESDVRFLFNNAGTAVPEAATGILMVAGMAGLFFLRRR